MVTLRVRQLEHDGGRNGLRTLAGRAALGIVVSLILCAGCEDFGRGRARQDTHPAEVREAPGPTAHTPQPDASTEVDNEKREAGQRQGPIEESGCLIDVDGYILSTYRESYVLSTYTVVRGFCCQKWGSPSPSKEFLFAGKEPVVDKKLGKWFFQGVAGSPPLASSRQDTRRQQRWLIESLATFAQRRASASGIQRPGCWRCYLHHRSGTPFATTRFSGIWRSLTTWFIRFQVRTTNTTRATQPPTR